MTYVSLDKLLDKAEGSIYKLVIVASKRALEIAEGQPKLVKSNSPINKPSIIALEEIAQGRVRIKKEK